MNDRQPSRLTHALLRLAIALPVLAIIVLVAVTLLRIPISLDSYRSQLESALGEALQRQVRIDGGITVTTSLWPYFELEGLHIANSLAFGDGDLATMEHARVTIGLLPLLQRKVRIGKLSVSGLTLDLQRSPDKGGNWVMQQSPPADEQPADPNNPDGTRLSAGALSVDQLLLEDISVSFRDSDNPALTFIMDSAEGAAATDQPMSLSMQGTLMEETFDLDVEASSLADFLAMTRSKLGIRLQIAGTRFDFSGLSEALRGGQSTELHMKIEGETLSSLNSLLRLDLPPLADYYLEAEMRAVPGRLELNSMRAGLGQSELVGNMLFDRNGKRPMATLDLGATSIQLNDFNTGDWVAADHEPAAAETDIENNIDGEDEQDPRSYEKLLSQATLQRADARMTVAVDEVMSGEDRLGSGRLQLSLREGRIDLNPVSFKLPQASLQLQASLKPDVNKSEAALQLRIDNFDFGVLTRLLDPTSEVGGTLNTDIDIKASAGDLRSILSGASGYLDVSVQPQNLRSGLVDLWAVNLLSAVVSSSVSDEEASRINCAIGRFRLTEGIMVAEQLVTDTSQIRICGEGQISFVEEQFDLEVAPRAKRPEFFSLGSPMAVKGEFDDFRIGMKAGVITMGTTAVNFAISPITVPLKRLFTKELPEDGEDICLLPIGQRTGELEPLPGC